MNPAHRTIKVIVRHADTGAAQQAAGTFKRLRGASRAGQLIVDEELELLHRVVVEGFGRTGKRVHDLGPVVDAPAAGRTARAH